MKKLIGTLLITIFAVTPVFATEEISVEELLGNNNENVDVEEVAGLEEERLEEIENELNISIPEYTDNPSHIITFVDPSEDKDGVEVDIDEAGFKEINSPYSLPSLSIGIHTLKFRFVDSVGATKTLEYETVIIPRPPLVKAPTFENDYLTVSGTGLANSEIIVTVSVNASNYTETADINSDGTWTVSIALDTTSTGIYTVFAYTRKDGYASNPSEPAVLAYGDDGATSLSGYQEETDDIYFSFNSIPLDNLPTIISTNPDLIILSIGFLLLGSGVMLILNLLLKKNSQDMINREYSRRINNTQPTQPEEKTLRELFTQEEDSKPSKKKKVKKTKSAKKKKEKKEKAPESKATEKTFTKRDFLKDFKKFDPDTNTGKENKPASKKLKKDVLVSLTSQKQD